MILETKNLALAAYIKANGGELLSQAGRMFIFETQSDKTLDAWKIEYSNSCCYRHDTELVGLRKLLKNRKDWP